MKGTVVLLRLGECIISARQHIRVVKSFFVWGSVTGMVEAVTNDKQAVRTL